MSKAENNRDLVSCIMLPALTVVLSAAFLVTLIINVWPLLPHTDHMAQLASSWSFPVAPFSQLPPLIVSAGALLALLTYRRDRKKIDHENARGRSEFFFRQASSGLDEVLMLLKDQNNDRVIWIRAARSLLQAQALAQKIELAEFRDAYRLHEQRIRNDLYLALTVRDMTTGHRHALPPQFFFGVSDWTAGKPLDQVAVQASTPAQAYSLTLDSVPPQSHQRALSEESVVAIFDFLDYPKDYEDPLRNVQVWTGDWTSTFGENQGAARFIAHRALKVAIGGKLHDRKPKVE